MQSERTSAISYLFSMPLYVKVVFTPSSSSFSALLAQCINCRIIPEEIQRIRKPTHANTKCFNHHVFVYIIMKYESDEPTHTHTHRHRSRGVRLGLNSSVYKLYTINRISAQLFIIYFLSA